MRVNVYAEEMTNRIEIIEKKIDGRTFTGLRVYLDLPVTLERCRQCQNIRQACDTDGYVRGRDCECGDTYYEPVQIRGPFMHHEADDDSSAVTFWGKRDLREVLKKMLAELDAHYEKRGG